MQTLQSRKKIKLVNNQTDIKLWNFEVEYIISQSGCKTAISYRKDFDFTKFSYDILNILNFVFFVPARVLLIFLGYPEFPDNRKEKNCFKNKLKVWKQMSQRGVEEFTKNYITQLQVWNAIFHEESQTLFEISPHKVKRLVRLLN